MLEAVRILGLEKKTKIYQASTSELFGLVHGPEQGLFRLFHIKNLRFKGTNDYSPAAPGSSSSRTHKNFVIFAEKTDTFMAYIHNKY